MPEQEIIMKATGRRTLAGGIGWALVALALVAAGCGQSAQPLKTTTLDSDRTVKNERFGNLVVEDGVHVTIDDDELIVDGDLTVGDGAILEGTQEILIIIIRGNLEQLGELRSAGHLVVVSDESLAPDIDDLETPEVTSGVDIAPAKGVANPRIAWNIMGPLVAAWARPLAPPPAQKGRRGRRGGAIAVHVRGNLNIRPAAGRPVLNISVPDGQDGENMSGCNVTGGDGGKGGKLRAKVTGGTLRLQDVSFNGGNGGAGGSGTGGPCASGSHNKGGEGGEPGTFRFSASGGAMQVAGSINISGWGGGDGGEAEITGFDGMPGATVATTGGDGGDVEGYSLRATSSVQYQNGASISLSIGNGGDGGNARSFAGNGLEGACNAQGVGGPGWDGGNADATAGEGGTVDVSVSVPGSSPIDTSDSFESGNGGDALAMGGKGGDGPDCPVRGGNGGHGGDAESEAGAAGTSNQGATGADGSEDAHGGLGGKGGNGEDTGGDGGDGGDAKADNAQGGLGPSGGSGGPTHVLRVPATIRLDSLEMRH
jgi:hypothetical protein